MDILEELRVRSGDPEAIERHWRAVDPSYDYLRRHGRSPKKGWNPTAEEAREFRGALLDTAAIRPGELAGYATLWNVEEDRTAGTKRMIERGCFEKCLRESRREVVCIVDHDWSQGIVARRSDGSLRLIEDAKGLFVRITPLDTPLGVRVRCHALFHPRIPMSFDGRLTTAEMERGDQLYRDYELTEVSLLLLLQPAIPGAAVTFFPRGRSRRVYV